MKDMDILILAHFSGSAVTANDNGRFVYLAAELAKHHEVEIVTTDFSHTTKAPKKKSSGESPFKGTLLHEPGYSRNVCLKRFWSHFVWGRNVRRYLAGRKKPDVIFCAVPSLTGPLAAAKYCRREGVRFVVDVQDLWPEAFQMVFHVPVLSRILFAPFRAMANGIYRRADAVCAVSQSYADRALSVNPKCAEGHSVFLGTRLEDFDRYVEENAVTDKPAGELWLGYCGTLGASYDLTCVLDALKLAEETGLTPPKFIVMGDGPQREQFESYAAQKGVNAVFTGRLPYSQMCGKLAACDIVVNPIIRGSVGSIINKHADYAASGLPVLNTQESAEYRALVETYRMGFNCQNGDAADLADKLSVLVRDEKLRREMGHNARRCAEERFDRKTSYDELVKVILDSEEALFRED